MKRADLKGTTIDIQGKRYLVLSCTFRQPSARDAAGWALLLLNERGELDQHMVGIDGPIKLIDGPRPIAAGSFADLAHRTQVRDLAQAAAVNTAPVAREVASLSRITGLSFSDIGKDPGFRAMVREHVIAEVTRETAGAAKLLAELDREQRDRSKPVTEITWAEYPNAMLQSCAAGELADAANAYAAKLVEQEEANLLEAAFWMFDAARAGRGEWNGRPQSDRDAFKMAARRLQAVRIHGAGPVACAEAINEQVARRHPIELSPAVEAAIADGGKVVQNRPLEVDRNRLLGSVPIAGYGECACRPGDTCPLGKDPAIAGTKCDIDELSAAGHNWHHDKPGTDNGVTVGTTAIPSTFDERVPDARILVLWENAHAGHDAIAHPVELQALCEEINQHRRAATEHHNSKHMQSLREQLHASRQLANQATKDLAAARAAARNEIEKLQRARDSAADQVRIMSAKVERLEFEIALVTKYPSVLPEMPLDCEERDGALYLCEPGRKPRLVEHPAAIYCWTKRLVAERNHAREVAIALQRRIDAMTRTMGPVAVQCEPTPGPLSAPTNGAPRLAYDDRWPDNVEPKRID